MAKITRYDGNLLPFAQNFTSGNRTIFGETNQSNDLTNNINAKFLKGWEATTDANTFPTKQDFNAVAYVSTALSSYLHQVGIPEWNREQEYHLDSFTNFNGVLYRCKKNNHTSIANPASDSVNWEDILGKFASKTEVNGAVGALDSATVKLTGNQTISGTKSFNSSPTVPNPTSGTHAANKDYVDSKASGGGVGVGQTWQNVTSSRNLGVTYTNNTGKPITLSVFISDTSLDDVQMMSIIITINGSTTFSFASGATPSVMGNIVIPSGQSYKVTPGYSVYVLTSWHELR